MIPALRREQSFPVALPAGLRSRPARRRRPSPVARVLVAAVLIALPPLAYVAQQNQVAQTGYRIVRLRAEIGRLERDAERLNAQVAALRSPDRIERIATGRLGMVLPRPTQLASLSVTAAARRPAVERTGWWQRLGEWFLRGEAQAAETRR